MYIQIHTYDRETLPLLTTRHISQRVWTAGIHK